MRLALSSPDAERRQRWRPAALSWAVFLIFTAGPLRQTTWTDPISGVPEGLMVLWTGRVAMLLLLAGLATAWSVAQEHRVSNPHLSLRSVLAGALSRFGVTWSAAAADPGSGSGPGERYTATAP
jgi:hypothetical protein